MRKDDVRHGISGSWHRRLRRARRFHVAGTGARYTRANPPRQILAKFACLDQSEASRIEAAIKKLTATEKRNLPGKSGPQLRRLLFDSVDA